MTETIRTDNSETLKNALLKIKTLEAQIEKMKHCGNCKYYSPSYELCDYSGGDGDFDCGLKKWELAEKLK